MAGERSSARRSVVYKRCRYTPDAWMKRGKTTVRFPSPMHRSVVIEPSPAVRPFLKWAGGKRQLLRELRRYVPRDFPAYHEPFLGSGALFFDLWRSNRLHGTACQLGDANADLVGVYRALADDTRKCDRAIAAAGERASGRRGPGLLPRARRSLQPRAAYPSERPGVVLPGASRGDVHLPQSHGLQRPVPAEFAGGFQRAGRALCRAADLRRADAPRRGRRAEIPIGHPASPHVHGRCRIRRSRGPGVFRSAVRAAQCHGAVHVVHLGEFFGKRPAGAAGSWRCSSPGAAARWWSAIRRRTS